jgi:hypothetical protein
MKYHIVICFPFNNVNKRPNYIDVIICAGLDTLEGWKALGIVGSKFGRFLFSR